MPTEEKVYTEDDVWGIIVEHHKLLEAYIVKELRKRGLGNKDAEQVFELTCDTARAKPKATFENGRPVGFMMETAKRHINHMNRSNEKFHKDDISDMAERIPDGSGWEITLGIEEMFPANMSEEDKKIFIYYYKFDVRVEDIAQLLHLNVNTVKQRLRRGRQKMNKKHWF